MKAIFILMGMILMGISILSFIGLLEDYEISKFGHVCDMKIVKKPSKCGIGKNFYMKVEFNDKTFVKKIGAHYCNEVKLGDIVQMQYYPKYDHVLFPEENLSLDFGANLILFGFAVFLLIKKPPKL